MLLRREAASRLFILVIVLTTSCAGDATSNAGGGPVDAWVEMDAASPPPDTSEDSPAEGSIDIDSIADELTEADEAHGSDANATFDVGTSEDASSPADVVDAPVPSFGAGIYYRQPNLVDPSAVLTRVAPPLGSTITMSPVGFDVRGDVLVFPYPAGLVVANVSGQRRQVPIVGLYGMVRPSLSPDGRRAVVQASATPEMPPANLDIFVVSLSDGTFRKISDLSWNEESPEWFPQSNRVAYSSFSPSDGVNLHVYDLDLDKETLLVKDGGALHLAVSPDEKSILDFWRLRAYDSVTGMVVADLRASLEAALPNTGYAIDAAHPGQGGRMTFVLDGAFSPDGASLVFDGAVTRDGQSGSVLFTTPLVQVALTPITSPIPLQYAFSNGNNFSQLNPAWR